MLHAVPCVPTLRSVCIQVVAASVGAANPPERLPDAVAHEIIASLPPSLPLEVAAVLVPDEEYWQRRARARWKNCDPTPHGGSWKQQYIERNLQEAIEQFNPQTDDPLLLRKLSAFSRRFVQGMCLQQLSAVDLEMLFDTLHLNLSRLSLCYDSNTKAAGINYSSDPAGMKLSDCRMLARALAHTEVLVVLDLRSNGLDDDKARMLASGLADNISLTQLNLSHNRISDRGARALAKLLDGNSVITLLDLSANQLQADSGRALARALCHSRALITLKLRLNRLGDEGCRAIYEALSRPGQQQQPQAPHAAAAADSPSCGSTKAAAGSSGCCCPLEQLDTSSNSAGCGVVPALCSMLRGNRTLMEVDISCNALGEQLSTDLVSAVSNSKGLLALEVRGCGIGSVAEQAMANIMLERAAQRGASTLICSWADGGANSGGVGLAEHRV